MLAACAAGVGYYLFREDPDDLLLRGEALLQRDPARAEVFFQRSLDVSRGSAPRAQLLLTQAFARQRLWIEALGSLGQVEASACAPTELIALAEFALRSDQRLLASEALRAALRPGPEEPAVLRPLISLCYQQGDESAALDYCDRLIEVAPRDYFPWRVRGVIHRDWQQVVEAINDNRQALDRTPPDPIDIRRDLADLLTETGDFAAARVQLDLVLQSPSANERDEVRQVTLLRWEDKPEEALAAAEKVLARQPGNVAARLYRGLLQLDRGDTQSARDDLVRVLDVQPANDVAHFKLAEAYLRLDKPDLAAHHQRESRRLVAEERLVSELVRQAAAEPHNADVRWKLVRHFESRNQKDEVARWTSAAHAAEQAAGRHRPAADLPPDQG